MPQQHPAPGTPLPFEKALNFRDLGGYRAQDGRTVRYGVFYRSGELDCILSDADKALYHSLGIRYILDLRSRMESAAHPDPVPEGARYECICAMRYLDGDEIDFSPAGMAKLQAELELVVSEEDSFMELYRRMAFRNPAFQALFKAMENDETPLLFHCSAGKDRTGIGAMLILLALGVDRETAIQDYLQTNFCRQTRIEAFLKSRAAEWEHADAAGKERLLSWEGVIRPMVEATLHAIEERYPSYEAYFEAEYGLDAARLAALRDRYLE